MENIIIKYLKGEATAAEKHQLLHWLNEDVANQKDFNDLADIWAMSNSKSDDEANTQRALARYQHKMREEESKNKRNSNRLQWWKIAASIAIVALCTSVGYFVGKGWSSSEAEILVMNHFVMGDGSKGTVTLPDGTKVWLNENSKLSYPDQFTGEERNVSLEGEAFFDVAKDKKKPFVAQTNDFQIKVLGTSFDIRNRAIDEKSHAVLLTGKIEVLDKNGETHLLHPNQKLVYDKLRKGYLVSEVVAEDYVLWTDDKIEFENEKLSTILNRLGYWYGIEIDCMQDVANDMRLSLVIRKENKEEIFRLLELIAPIECKVNSANGRVLIKKK